MTEVALIKRSSRLKGGLEKYTSRLLAMLQDLGHSVTLFDTPPKSAPFSFQKIAAFDRAASSFLRQNPHEAVIGMCRTRIQTHLRAGNGIHAAYLKMRSEREGWMKRLSFHINPLHRVILDIERSAFTYPGLRKIVVNSELVKNELLFHYPVDPEKVDIIHNGVEWHEFARPFEEPRPLSPYYELLFIGHNFERKGLKPLLRALELLPKNLYHLSVIGTDKEIESYKHLARHLNVTFLGSVANPLPYYQKADCLVIPSYYDPFANVTVEALAMGLLVISSPHNGGKEVLTEKSGIILEEVSPEALVNALLQAFHRPKTPSSALEIRESVRSLDFSLQLAKMCSLCLF